VIDIDWVNQQLEPFNTEFVSPLACGHPLSWHPDPVVNGSHGLISMFSPNTTISAYPHYSQLRASQRQNHHHHTVEAPAPPSKGKSKAVDSLEEQLQKKQRVAASSLKLEQKLRWIRARIPWECTRATDRNRRTRSGMV